MYIKILGRESSAISQPELNSPIYRRCTLNKNVSRDSRKTRLEQKFSETLTVVLTARAG